MVFISGGNTPSKKGMPLSIITWLITKKGINIGYCQSNVRDRNRRLHTQQHYQMCW